MVFAATRRSGTARACTLRQGTTTITSGTTSSTGPVSLAWPTSAADNSSRTATVSVRDAAGRTGAASVAMIVDN